MDLDKQELTGTSLVEPKFSESGREVSTVQGVNQPSLVNRYLSGPEPAWPCRVYTVGKAEDRSLCHCHQEHEESVTLFGDIT